MALVLIVVLIAGMYFAKLMVESRRQELDLRSREDTDTESGSSLTESELANLIREAVREETAVVLDRLREVEERVGRLDDPSNDVASDDESTNERKTLGRRSRSRP